MAIMSTGGNLPPEQVRTMTTGGNLPATPVPGTGTSTSSLPTRSPIQMMDWQATMRQGDENAQTRNVQGNELVSNQLNTLTAGNSQYIRQAEDAARNEASARGMMMSTMAAGAGRRAAIDAALPIASQDATTYGRTASENMAAVNADRMQDQSIHGQLTGQALGIRANLDESERARGFTSQENLAQRSWQTGERLGSQQFQTGERIGTQQWQTGERTGTQAFQQSMQQMQNAWQGAQNNSDRQQQLTVLEQQQAHDAAMRELDRTFQGTQQEKQLAQQRFLEFENAMQNQGAQLAQVIASIYNNPNLTSVQQAAAVTNARATFQSIFTSYAQSLAGGIPQIFWNPYPMPASSLVTAPTTNTPTAPVLPANPAPTTTTTPRTTTTPTSTTTNTAGTNPALYPDYYSRYNTR